MHFFHKTVGLVALLCVAPCAFAATARPQTERIGVVTTASSRMPTMAVKTTGTTSSGSTTSSALLANAECIDAYTACIKGADACGENFEECTTRVLFHGKMPNCLSTLAQCSSAGVNSLFGTSNVASLASGATKNTYGEITDYTYPTDGSVLGQMITAAAISNRYDTSTCVRRVTSCLRRDTVCGEDFELCTTNTDFRKQRVFCDSTLARCQSEGVIELLGSSNRTAMPSEKSRIGEMILEGQALAAVNSVNTCYKTVDQCVLAACSKNPYRCYETNNADAAGIAVLAGYADAVLAAQEQLSEEQSASTLSDLDGITKKSIRGYIQNACFTTIGANKYCHATFLKNGQMPTNAELRDPEKQEDVFELAYEARMNTAMKAKIADLVDKFDEKAKKQCTETIKSCAMRTCGGGLGSACYSLVNGQNGQKSINGGATYADIKSGCEIIVNTDLNCKYAAANLNATGPYSYAYIDGDAFETLFPKYVENEKNDPIGVVATLNASLAANYNDAAIAQMRRSCENVAKSCIKSMCGSEYTNCYRNRTDIVSGTYDTGTGLDKSMNKMGGVLDNNIVIGLCLDTIKNASACEEHLAIQTAKSELDGTYKNAWGDNDTVRSSWLDANSTTAEKIAKEDADYIETGLCHPSNTNNPKCKADDWGICDTVDADGCMYDGERQKEYYYDFVLNNTATTVLQQVLVDIEKEAQATYNAKLTKEQNMCMAANEAGGIMGARDIASTFMWAKLNSAKVPANYNVNGLKPTAFKASNDLYGSFCRVRITLQSDDKKIQEAMKNKSWTTAYFAVGDAFTCGSWIPADDLDELANAVANDATKGLAADQKRARTWATVLGALGGGAGGYIWGDSIRQGNSLAGLTGWDKKTQTNKAKSHKTQCLAAAENVKNWEDMCSTSGMDNCAKVVTYWAGQVADHANELKLNAQTFDVKAYKGAITNTANCNLNECDALISTLAEKTEEVSKLCESVDADEFVDSNDKTRWGVPVVTSVALAGAGALLVNRATRDIQNSELDAAQKAAYEDWMNKVGRHITCYIGGDEAGSYGDVISTSLE